MPKWRLENAQEIADENPYTFYKPAQDVVSQLKPGNTVKLIFAFEAEDPESPGAERMWVMIDEIKDGYFKGRLDNDPCYIQDLKCDDSIEFQAEHIIATEFPDPVNDQMEKYFQRCYVSNRILNKKRKPHFIYKEVPDFEDDGGWRILEGDETDEFLDNAEENLSYVAIGCILNQDDSFVSLLDAPVGSEFEWHEDLKSWQEIN